MSLKSNQPPLFVFGISGATWDIIDPLIASGYLPNFKKLQDQGCRTTLLSVKEDWDKHYRPQVAWASAATGFIPEKHGVTKFYHTADDLKVPTLWEIYQQHGLGVGVYGWPLDWPVRPTNGFIVPSHLARDSQTWPPELSIIKALDREQQDAERDKHYRVTIGSKIKKLKALSQLGLSPRTFANLAKIFLKILVSSSSEERSLLLRHAKIELSSEIFLSLCKKYNPHFCSFHTFLVDLASHRYWRYYQPDLFPKFHEQPSATLKEAVVKAYIHTDAILGRLIANLPSDTTVAVLSEHGMAAEPQSAEVGDWRYVINGNKLSEFVGLKDKIIACPVARWVAFKPNTGDTLPADTAERFQQIIVQDTGLPLFQVYQHGVDEVIVKFNIEQDHPVYRQGKLDSLTLTYRDQIIPFLELVRRLGKARSAMHTEQGILLIAGKGIRSGVRLPPASILDITPTLLQASGLPWDQTIDGRPLNIMIDSPN